MSNITRKQKQKTAPGPNDINGNRYMYGKIVFPCYVSSSQWQTPVYRIGVNQGEDLTIVVERER